MINYIKVSELYTKVKEVELKAIIQNDEGIASTAIETAIEFAEGKLGKYYDTDAIFAKTGNDRSKLLVDFIKDIAIWKIICLANPSIDYDDCKFRYQEAVAWFQAVYDGMKLSKKNFPPIPEDAEEKPAKNFSITSNPKRENRF